MRIGRLVTPRRAGLRIAVVAVFALAVSGCFRPLAIRHQQTDPDTRPWWCHSMGGEGTHGSEYYMSLGITKGMLDWTTASSSPATWTTRSRTRCSGRRVAKPRPTAGPRS
ncbi:MAG: hypothetical protein KatS3mg009_2569 [Acidimicrobiia bacterium]|nr:MAG: hypothetical protein KatS3mg009_2569 [Acidimicrobiia bacterium]